MNRFITYLSTTLLFGFLLSCGQTLTEKTDPLVIPDIDSTSISQARNHIGILLDSFNIYAARADFDNYFKYFDEDAVFIGTDATENWNKQSFMAFSKPYFDKGKAWDFKSIDRNIYFDPTGNIAWFDELLNTQMKICRGSGVLEKKENEWKIKQYVLSMTIPNSNTKEVIKLKEAAENEIIISLIKE
jgi:hypothetical protein